MSRWLSILPIFLAGIVVVEGMMLADARERIVALEGRGAPPDELARQATAHLEAHVRSYPQSWLWLHRRWKRLPAAGSSTLARS